MPYDPYVDLGSDGPLIPAGAAGLGSAAPQNDADLARFVQDSKQTFDSLQGKDRQAHIDSAAKVVQDYYERNPRSTMARDIMTAMHSDPKLNLSSPHPDFALT